MSSSARQVSLWSVSRFARAMPVAAALALVGGFGALTACKVAGSGGDDDDDDVVGDDDDDDNVIGDAGADRDGADPIDAAADHPQVDFSFFVTSLATMQLQADSDDGFGGDFGGLAGADAICQTAAENVGFGYKTWRAFLSVTEGPEGGPVNAIDRIGLGPWYDRNGRMIAEDLDGLRHNRPDGDAQTVSDLPDESGQPLSAIGDAHDIATGSNQDGELDSDDPAATCNDWTSAVGPGSEEIVNCGHSFPAPSGQHWIASHQLRGCAPGVNLEQNGPGSGDCIGCSGGFGGIYCFALEP